MADLYLISILQKHFRMKELSGLMSTGRWRIVISFHIVDIFVYPLIMHTFGKRQTGDLFFLMFPRKIGSKLHTNCLQNLLKCQNYFLEKKERKKEKKTKQKNNNSQTKTKQQQRKKKIKMSSAEIFTHSAGDKLINFTISFKLSQETI